MTSKALQTVRLQYDITLRCARQHRATCSKTTVTQLLKTYNTGTDLSEAANIFLSIIACTRSTTKIMSPRAIAACPAEAQQSASCSQNQGCQHCVTEYLQD